MGLLQGHNDTKIWIKMILMYILDEHDQTGLLFLLCNVDIDMVVWPHCFFESQSPQPWFLKPSLLWKLTKGWVVYLHALWGYSRYHAIHSTFYIRSRNPSAKISVVMLLYRPPVQAARR